jgi:hypothetical protein
VTNREFYEDGAMPVGLHARFRRTRDRVVPTHETSGERLREREVSSGRGPGLTERFRPPAPFGLAFRSPDRRLVMMCAIGRAKTPVVTQFKAAVPLLVGLPWTRHR